MSCTDPAVLASSVRRLAEQGYCILDALMPLHAVDHLAADLAPVFARTPRAEGAFYGNDTRRFGSLLVRSDETAAFVQHPMILAIVEAVLGPWCDRIALNLTQAIELLPGSIEQVPHRDQDMWPCSRLVRSDLGVEFLVNVMWPFTPYGEANGATLVWPGSHRRQDEPLIDRTEALPVEMPPGAALIFLGSTLHAGGANRTPAPRRGMIISYTLGWLKPYELPWLAYPPKVAASFAPDLAALAGYRIHRPNLGNFEGRCPSSLLEVGSAERGAIDALGPEQVALIEAYRSGHVLAPAGSEIVRL